MRSARFVPLVCFLLLAASVGRGADEVRPNLVVIMVDDLGYADVGFNGCRDIPTPHIDSLSQRGVTFTNGYTCYPVCAPSRAGFLTGRYPQRFGFERNVQYRPGDPRMGLPSEERTMADALAAVGYRCGVIGKWHLGAHPSLHPLRRGFHEFYGHLGGGHRYLPDELTIRDSYEAKDEAESYRTWIMRNDEPVAPRTYLTDEFSDEAVQFVERHAGQPFFLFLSYNAPHAPLQATEEYLKRFEHIPNEKRRTYAAMVSAVDDGVGRLTETLQQRGLMDNTLVFFLSDNGGVEANACRNTPLRGFKSDVWEGGYRVPFVAVWPGVLSAGSRYEHPVTALDIFATIAARSGARPDPQRPLDGVDLLPYLTGEKQGRPHETLFVRKFDQQRYAVRHGDHKLVISGKNSKPALFDLGRDISERNDLAAEEPETLASLERLRKNWSAELIDPIFLGLMHTDAWGKAGQDPAESKPGQTGNATSAPASQPAEPTITPAARAADRKQEWHLSRHTVIQHELTRRDLSEVDLVMVGDTLGVGWLQAGAPHWRALLGDKPRSGLNLSVPGDRTEHTLLRLLPQDRGGLGYFDDPRLRPRIIVLSIGVHNVTRHEPEQIVRGVRAVCARLQTLAPQAQVVLCSLPPTPNQDRNRKAVAPINRDLQKIPEVRWLDLYADFADGDGRQRPEYFREWIIPNAAGYQLWRDRLAPICRTPVASQPAGAGKGTAP